MSSHIFRKSALERISSPEQLDALLQITTPQNWLALIGLLGLLLAGLVWGIFGRIPVEVSAPTVFIYPGGIQNVPITTNGQLGEIYRVPGDFVQAGETVALVHDLSGETIPVVSPHAGRVLELKASEGSMVTLGMPLLSVEALTEDGSSIEAALFLSAAEAASVAVGQSVKIATAYQEELGYVRGQVKTVNRYPATMAGLLNILGSEDLIQTVVRSPNPIEVRVTLEPTAVNSQAFAAFIRSGSTGSAAITIDEQRPIEFVLPIGE
jgi:hypothetical protein